MSKKRGHGEGCITKRKDGKWAAVVTVGRYENGKLKRKFFYGNSRQEAAGKLNKALSEVKAGIYIEPSKSTLGEWLDYWFEEYAMNNVRLSTKVSYEHYIKKHIKPVIGYIQLKELRGDMLQKFYNDKQKSGRLDGKGGLNPKTIKNIHNMLNEALEQAYKNDLIARNPCKIVILPKIVRKEMRVLSPEEQKQLQVEANKERLGIGIILDLFAGLRLGELLGLQWKDIDLKKGILSVKQTLNRLKNYDGSTKTSIVIGDTKTPKSKRKIPLNSMMVHRLEQYKSILEQEKVKADELYNDNDYLLCNELGTPIEPRTYQDFFKRLLKRAKIPDANFHCLRHTFATRALEKGIPAKTVSEILGHSNISTTLDLYSHVSLDLKRDSIEKLSDLFI